MKLSSRLFSLFLLLVLIFIGQNNFAQAKSIYQEEEFTSQIDNAPDSYAFASPITKDGEPATLLVYLHGLDLDFLEPFKIPQGVTIAQALRKEYPHLAILSCNYGKKPSWGTKAARVDISENIHAALNKCSVDHIILAGTSMGACTALIYAAGAPRDIKDKIIGVIAAYPALDLTNLYKLTDAALVKTSMEGALGGKPTEDAAAYRQNSFESYLPFFPREAKVGIISASEDTAVPPKLQKDVEQALTNRDVNVKFFSIEGTLQPPPVKTVLDAMKFILQ